MLKIIISVLCILTFEKINSMEFLNGLADFCNRLGQIGTMSQVPQYNQQQAWNSQYNTTPQFNQMYTQQPMYMQNQQTDVDWFGAPSVQFLVQNGFNDQMRINVVQQFFQLDSDYPANLAYQYDNTLKDQIMHFINSRQSIMNDTAVNCAGRRQRGSHYESVQYDDDDSAGSEEASEDSLDQYSWGDEDYVETITDDANFNSLKGILSNATLLRYTLEMWKHENPDEYQALLNAVSFYNTTVAAGKMAAAASCIASTGPVGLVPIAASLAVFQGVELFAEAVSKYGADKLAARVAGRDPRKYESYFKTCKHFTDFVAGFGVQALSTKCCNTKKHHSVDNDKGTTICDKQRIIGTPQMQKDFISNMLREKIWEKTTHKIGGKQAFYCKSNNLWYTKVMREKNDIEVWKVSGKRAKHIGAIECKYGTMYEGPKHPDAKFE